MAGDEVRARYLRDRVLTASPAQRVVMLYDRLNLDLSLAGACVEDDPYSLGVHVGHAMQIVVELQSSLDTGAGGAAANLASLYAYVVTELIAIRGGAVERLPAVTDIIGTLRDAWAQAAQLVATEPPSSPAAAGAWVG